MPIQLLLILCAFAFPQQVPACGGFYTSPSGSFSSPLYPSQYPPHQDCVYIINATEGYRITLTFLNFQLQAGSSGCIYDYLLIREGSTVTSPSLGIYCSTTVPDRVRSTSNSMWIKFHSDSSVSGAGFEVTYTTAIIPQKFLLVTDTGLNAIIHVDMETVSNFNIPLDGLQNPIAVDLDPPTGRIYWTDVEEKTIRSANLDGSDIRLVRTLGQDAVPDGLVVDSLSRLIFYTDAGNHVIGRITMYSNRHQIVIESIDSPRDIELDKHNGVIFWTDWGATPKIERANYDGTGRKTLVSGFQYLYWPSALALDTAGGKLYWTDTKIGTIGWVTVEGGNATVIVQTAASRFFGMDIYLNYLFVTDWGTEVVTTTTFIHRVSADGRRDTIFATARGRVNDIRVYAEETEDKGPNGCGNNNGGCSYICIPTPGNRSKCLTESEESTSTETSDRTTATSDRTTATSDRTTATSDRTTATSDRTTATSDSTATDRATTKDTETSSPTVIIVACVAAVLGIAVIVIIVFFLRTIFRRRNSETPGTLTRREDDPNITSGSAKVSGVCSTVDFDEENIYHECQDINEAEVFDEYIHPVRCSITTQGHGVYMNPVFTSSQSEENPEISTTGIQENDPTIAAWSAIVPDVYPTIDIDHEVHINHDAQDHGDYTHPVPCTSTPTGPTSYLHPVVPSSDSTVVTSITNHSYV